MRCMCVCLFSMWRPQLVTLTKSTFLLAWHLISQFINVKKEEVEKNIQIFKQNSVPNTTLCLCVCLEISGKIDTPMTK